MTCSKPVVGTINYNLMALKTKLEVTPHTANLNANLNASVVSKINSFSFPWIFLSP